MITKQVQLWMIVATALIVCGVMLVPPTLAQQPPGLHLEKETRTTEAIAGQHLIIVLTLTNQSDQALSDLVVEDLTPPGTHFYAASAPRDWTIITPNQGTSGTVTWQSMGTLPPGAQVELEMVVTVESDTNQDTLTSPGYTVRAAGLDEPLTGPDLVTPVVDPPPAASFPWVALSSIIILSSALLALAIVWLRHRRRGSSAEVQK